MNNTNPYPFWPDQNPLWPREYQPYNHHQLNLDLVEPLTEQLTLDLDYTRTHAYENRLTSTSHANSIAVSNGTTGINWVSQSLPPTISIDAEQLTILVKKKPSMMKRILMKTLGLEWKLK